MFKKLILSAVAAIAMIVSVQAPASAAMPVAKPAVAQSDAASAIVEVGGRRGGFRRGGGFRRHGGFRRRHWGRHHRWHHRHYWGPRHYYRNCYWYRGHKFCSYH
jgi:hypothetical protein